MAKQNNLTEDQQICNKAWALFNQAVNTGLSCADAKVEALLDAEKLKIDYETTFEKDPDNPDRSEMIWEASMKQFDKLYQQIQSIA